MSYWSRLTLSRRPKGARSVAPLHVTTETHPVSEALRIKNLLLCTITRITFAVNIQHTALLWRYSLYPLKGTIWDVIENILAVSPTHVSFIRRLRTAADNEGTTTPLPHAMFTTDPMCCSRLLNSCGRTDDRRQIWSHSEKLSAYGISICTLSYFATVKPCERPTLPSE
jgi:hypothetical protein